MFALRCPNRVQDLSAYWEHLYAQDTSVPALKPYLAREGERVWRELLLQTDEKPSLVQLNSYLGLYTKSLFFNRAKSVFQSIEVPFVLDFGIVELWTKTRSHVVSPPHYDVRQDEACGRRRAVASRYAVEGVGARA